MAVGFSISLIRVPIGWTVALIALQAFLFSLVGLSFAARIKPFLGEWAEKLAAAVLGCLGIWMFVEALVRVLP